MSSWRALIRKFEPVLRFSTDHLGRPELFFPIAARDYVHSSGLRRRRVGWLQRPGDTILGHLATVSRPRDCYLAYAAGDLETDVSLEAGALMAILDTGLELGRTLPPRTDLEGAQAPSVTPRILLATTEATQLAESLGEWTEVERRPVSAAELSIVRETGGRPAVVDPGRELPLVENASELTGPAAAPGATGLEWLQFPALAPLPHLIRVRALQKYAPFRDWIKHPPVYHFHVSHDRGYTVLQYWFLYPYNDWASHGGHNDHEGDWEVVYVFLDRNEAPRHVAYSRHITIPLLYGPLTAPWDEIEKARGEHPVVYVGCGSHASYLERGDHPFFLYRDRARGDFLAIGPGAEQAWGEPVALQGKKWNDHFSGAWGALVKRWWGKVLPHTEGPSGPAHKGDKWRRPARWAGVPALDEASEGGESAIASREENMNDTYEQVVLQQALAEPRFDALTIQLRQPLPADARDAAQQILDAAVNEVLGAPAAGWTIADVHHTRPGAFDLLPPEELPITVAQGFDLKYALEAQPAVETAEALFETNLDNVPEPILQPELEHLDMQWFGDVSEPERDPLWSLRLVRAHEIWSQTQGEGITVGHPDSGYIPHPELEDSRILHDRERDFYDGDSNAQNPQERGGNHGLSTASVILSGHDHADDRQGVFGVAPRARIIPMRITKKGPPVFLFQSGPRRVREAIYHAIDNECDVISMSLGGVGESSLRRALQEAVHRNIIVLAAAGNGVPFVVWPARYPETIAVAACDINRGRWDLSSRGPTVDVTAPGHNVWRAYYDEDGRQAAKPSSGTSYAVATVGGVAALWLAYHGREQILQRYEGTHIKINEVFRRLLAETADDPPTGHDGQFGAGIINVKRLLEAPLPDPQSFPAATLESIAVGGVPPAEQTATEVVATVFDTVPQQEVRERLPRVTDVPSGEFDELLEGLEEELLFHMVTNPALRGALVTGPPSDTSLEGLEPPGLTAVPHLSQNLRRRLVQSGRDNL